jgi:hypothetical protein
MLSVKECKKQLENGGKSYDEKEVEEIRDLLYKLAQIEYEHFKNTNDGTKSGDIHESID